MLMNPRHCLILFLDGVGLGEDDPASNPFVSAETPHLTHLLGPRWYLKERGLIQAAWASLAPTDANLGVDGRPQSASGQAAILTGRNVPQIVQGHIGPWPSKTVRAVIEEGNLFHDTVAAGQPAVLLNAYPQPYFDAIARGRRMYSSIPLAVVKAGLPLLTTADLHAGRAISPGFTNTDWRDRLEDPDVPILTPFAAGQRLAHLAQRHTFSFFDHWLSDIVGHRGPLTDAVDHLETLDAVIGGLLEAWDDDAGLLIITSDHGNLEDKRTTSHTRNPVPTILAGRGHAQLAAGIHDLTDIAPAVRQFLGLKSSPIT